MKVDRMQMLGGPYGTGGIYYSSSQRCLIIPSTSFFRKDKTIPLYEVGSVEQISGQVSKRVGDVVTLGGGYGASAASLGTVLGGPVGAIIGGLTGAALGALMSRKKDEAVFSINLTNGTAIVCKSEYADYTSLLNAIGGNTRSSRESKPRSQAVKASSRTSSGKRKKYEPIEGRNKLKGPEPDDPYYIELKSIAASAETDKDLCKAIGSNGYLSPWSTVMGTIAELNKFKWRYFDVLINQNDIKMAVCISIRRHENMLKTTKSLLSRDPGSDVQIQQLKWHETWLDSVKRYFEPLVSKEMIESVNSSMPDPELSLSAAKAIKYLIAANAEIVSPEIPSGSLNKSEEGMVKKSAKERLLNLKDMMDSGLITEDEYTEQRRRIISAV